MNNELNYATARLSGSESHQLSEALGDSWWGNVDHCNSETAAVKAMIRGESPETPAVVREQIERSQDIIAPYVGRIVGAKTSHLILHEGGEWGEVYIPTPGPGRITQRARGTIKGIEGHVVRIRTFDNVYGTIHESPHSRERAFPRFNFRIGIVLDPLVENIDWGSHNVEEPAPAPDSVLIAIHDFPQTGHASYLSNGLGR